LRAIWNFFSSTILTVVLAALICADAIWGSILTVNSRPFYQVLDSVILLPGLFSMGGENLSLTLWIYILIVLITLFAVNTFVCTTDRLLSIVSAKSPWQMILPHIVHIGFLIALVGHLLGSSYGFKSPQNFIILGDSLPVPMNEGLSVRLDNIDVKASPYSGELESIKTTVTLFEAGSEVLSGDIEMNGPLIYKGIAFYHINHGKMPMGLILRAGGELRRVAFDAAFKGAKGEGFKLGTLYPDFFIESSGRPASRSREFRNPRQEIISSSGERGYLNISSPGGSITLDGITIELHDYMMESYAVLAINKDPGIWFIIAGSLVLTIGIILIFLFRGGRAELTRKPQKQALSQER
jgi:hypothetical protein